MFKIDNMKSKCQFRDGGYRMDFYHVSGEDGWQLRWEKVVPNYESDIFITH